VTALFCTGSGNVCGNTSNVQVPLLTGVTLPDGSAYSMPVGNYHLSETGACPNSRRILNGQLERLELPTGGGLEWDWDVWGFPQESRHHGGVRQGNVPPGLVFTRSAGLTARRHVKRNNQTLGSWTYDQSLHQAPGTFRFTESRTEVIDPLGHRNVHFFSVYHDDFDPQTPEPPGWDRHEYGLPFTKRVSDGTSPGRFLSQEVHGSGGAHLRSIYVRYERDGPSPDNPRMASQRTVFHDDAGRRADLNLSNFDGLGNFRQAVATGNFPGVATRTTFTNWNPSGAPADSAPWVLDTYDLRQVTQGTETVMQGSETVTQEFWFRNDGFLRRTRTRRAAACGTADVIVDRIAFPNSHATSPGFLAREDIYGGDGASLPCGALSSLDLSAQPLQFRRRHTYSCGSLATSRWFRPSDDSTLSFLSVDQTIDCSTGLASSSRDISGLQTSYAFDDLGRITSEAPGAGEAGTVYIYTPESASSPAKVAIRRRAPNGTILSGGQVEFDGFGRVEREVRDLPGGGQAERTSSWTARGDLFARTEWHAPNTVTGTTSFNQIDPFGRPRRIFLPDGVQIDIGYSGEGSRSIAVPVATGISAAGEPTFTTATTTETYDRFGQLLRLTEPNGTRTSYSYAAQGNLTRVEMNDLGSPIQVRSFTYDHRGFLTSESHPELGTSVLYSDYDAMGNSRRMRRGGWDLAYTYDPAGRLTEIRERGTTRLWKEWEYATANFQAGIWSNGKLATAVRHNRVFLPGTTTEIAVPVTEDYEYSGVGGRINEVTTTVGVGAVEDNTRPVFDYDLVYDALGNVSSRTYPRCTFNFCSPKSPFRTVTGTFTEGLLSAVPGYASSITYHPNGLVSQVSHANGVLDLQEKDPTDMTRPRRLRTSGASEEFDTGVYSWDGAGNVTKMGNFRFAYDLLSRVMAGQMEVPGGGCGQELLLNTGTDSGTTTHQSCGTVRAEGTYRVGSTGNVTLRAGSRVVLGDGFSVASGGRLTLETDPSLDPEGDPTDATQTYTYDRFGNLLTMTTELEGQNPVTRTLTTNSATNRLSVATYDSSGNVMSWAGRQYRWDPFNMLTQEKPTAGNGHTFLYGPGDERIWTIDWTAGAASSNWLETWTLRDLDGTVLRQFQAAGGNNSNANWSFHRDFVYRNASLLAAHTPQGLRHFHLDHLGSPRLVTDSSGDTLEQHLYFPFGDEATDPGPDAPVLKFTGHERDDLDSGGATADLDYMHQRFFSPHLGRFLSFDPAVESASPRAPQSWNRFSYVQGNPLKYIDPTGEVISLSGLEDTDIVKLLEDLHEFTGNTYGIDDNKNLVLLEIGEGSSGTATDFLNQMIGATEVYSVNSFNGTNILFGGTPTGSREIRLDFSDFAHLDYGKVNPATFNTATTLVHELAHAALGLKDPPVDRRSDEIGPTVEFVNQIRTERGLPTRGPAYRGASRGFFGLKRGINFQGVHPRHPGRIYYVDFPKKLRNQ
jgi:RHS repeat-associated protein